MAEANRAHNLYELLAGKINTLSGKKGVTSLETKFVPAPIKFYSVKFIERNGNSFFGSINDYARSSDIYKANKENVEFNLEADNFFYNQIIPGYSPASLLVLNITLPNISTENSEIDISNDFGKFVFGGKGALIPSDNNITINFMHLEYPIHEKFIFPWIRETQSNVWMRKETPFYKFDIQVDFFSNNNDGEILYSYKFTNAFPTGYNLPELGDATDLTRPVTFKFNNVMLIPNPKIYNNTRTQNTTISKIDNRKKLNPKLLDGTSENIIISGNREKFDLEERVRRDTSYYELIIRRFRKPYPPIPSFPGNENLKGSDSLFGKILGKLSFALKRATIEKLINKSPALKKINSITGGGLTTLGENPGKIIGAVMSGDMSTLKNFARGPIQSALFALNRKLKGLGGKTKKLPKVKPPNVKLPNRSIVGQTMGITGGFSPIEPKINIENYEPQTTSSETIANNIAVSINNTNNLKFNTSPTVSIFGEKYDAVQPNITISKTSKKQEEQSISIDNKSKGIIEPSITITGKDINPEHTFDVQLVDSTMTKTLEDRVAKITMDTVDSGRIPSDIPISMVTKPLINQEVVATNSISKKISKILRR